MSVGVIVGAFSDVEAWQFFPRAYNLNDPSDFTTFVTDFRWSAAEAILRKALQDGGLHPKVSPPKP